MKFAAHLFASLFFTTLHVVRSGQPAFKIGSTDFPALVESGTYIDKSLIVKTFAEKNNFVGCEKIFSHKPFIAGPQNFGKTINILTLKHYFEIEVDRNGNEKKNKKKTKNYSLFKNLKIFKHREIFKASFGRYPVIFIDFEPINRITNEQSMHENLRTVILDAFLQHKYLSKVKNSNIRHEYEHFIERHLEQSFPENINFSGAVTILRKLLFDHFNRKTITLFDNCDAVFNAIVFGDYLDNFGRLVYHYHVMFEWIIDKSFNFHYCLATGALYIADIRTLNYESDNEETPYPHFWGFRGYFDILSDHPYSEYYGINDRELCELLKFTDNSSEAEKLKADISKFYGTYAGRHGNRTVYNTLSVLKYLQNRKLGDPHALKSYWETPTFIKSISNLLNQKTVRKIALSVLKNETFSLLQFSNPDVFHLRDAELLKTCIREGFDNEDKARILFRYLASLGYFCILDEEPVIPNWEIRTEIKNILRQGVSDDGNNKQISSKNKM